MRLTLMVMFAWAASASANGGAPLTLQSVGSFFVGGHAVFRTEAEAGLYGGGSQTVGQMYVQYMIPDHPAKPPVVMIHGGTLSGKTYETTPDGRMGWYEYFARNGFPSYVVDQVGRGRSGFDQAPFNDVRAGTSAPDSQPNLRRVADEIAWVRFRFGPAAGIGFEDTQFPIEAVSEFAKQSLPDLTQFPPPAGDPNYADLAELSGKLNRTILIGHSQSGRYPFETALLNPDEVAALVAIEPAGCKSGQYSDREISKLARIPILVVFGDHLDMPQSHGSSWLPFFQDCEAFVARINAVKGKARMLHLPELGVPGNSHMLMQDKNNLQIADLIMDWISQRVPRL